jgi:hypothetical protein
MFAELLVMNPGPAARTFSHLLQSTGFYEKNGLFLTFYCKLITFENNILRNALQKSVIFELSKNCPKNKNGFR